MRSMGSVRTMRTMTTMKTMKAMGTMSIMRITTAAIPPPLHPPPPPSPHFTHHTDPSAWDARPPHRRSKQTENYASPNRRRTCLWRSSISSFDAVVSSRNLESKSSNRKL